MSYIGSTPASQAFAPGTDTFSGDGTTVAFTLSRNVATVNDILVVVNNVDQQPTAYTVASNVLTFSAAPSSGTNNIYVRYLSTNLVTIAPGQGTVGANQLVPGTLTAAAVSDQANTSTGYFSLPAGTTAQRPVSPANGMIRFNTSNSEYEVYDSGSWRALVDQASGIYTVTYLVVGGGGGGGFDRGGGGGAGGLLTSTTSVTSGTGYTVTIGAGGVSNSGQGNNSVFGAITALGGGAGSKPPTAGGSGGGAGSPGGYGGGAGTAGQGNNGGAGTNIGGAQNSGGGGGGAGAIGGNGSGNTGAAGGVGVASSISGTSVFYAGGGGGGYDVRSGGTVGAGGNGGGGAGGSGGVSGTANTGGGGGGGNGGIPQYNGGVGGSGIVIISYAGAQRGSGGTVTSSGGNTIHTFTTSGTFTA